MLESAGIAVVRDEVIRVDKEVKQVICSQGQSFSYDKLFLATGSRPFVPALEGADLEGVLTLRGLPDAARIKNYLAEHGGRNIVFVGAGFISMEIASLMMGEGQDFHITVIEMMDRPLPLMLDADMAGFVREYLEDKGITIATGRTVQSLRGRDGRVASVVLENGEEVEADVVFMNVGVRPNVELGEQLGLEMGRFGIKVNEYQETSEADILAGGDCVEKFSFITREPTPGQLRGPAVVQGRLAAKRLAGYDIAFPGVLDAGGCKMFDMTVTATGFTEARARQEGIETVSAVVDSRSRHNMIPGVKPWKLKLVFERSSGRLIGGQIVSHAVAPAREIDAVTALILGGKTAPDLTTFTSACNPDISSEPSAEPITIAAEQALQQLRKGAKTG